MNTRLERAGAPSSLIAECEVRLLPSRPPSRERTVRATPPRSSTKARRDRTVVTSCSNAGADPSEFSVEPMGEEAAWTSRPWGWAHERHERRGGESDRPAGVGEQGGSDGLPSTDADGVHTFDPSPRLSQPSPGSPSHPHIDPPVPATVQLGVVDDEPEAGRILAMALQIAELAVLQHDVSKQRLGHPPAATSALSSTSWASVSRRSASRRAWPAAS